MIIISSSSASLSTKRNSRALATQKGTVGLDFLTPNLFDCSFTNPVILRDRRIWAIEKPNTP
eukprot:10788235-Karenia_brevis.AAC.1